MAKKNVLDFDFDQHVCVIGIASNDKIWTLSWKLNQALGINLGTAENDVTRVKGPHLYVDHEAESGFEYTFFENSLKPSQGSKVAREFRFWLVVRGQGEHLPDSPALLRAVSSIDIVSLAHDLTLEKDIKKLLP